MNKLKKKADNLFSVLEKERCQLKKVCMPKKHLLISAIDMRQAKQGVQREQMHQRNA
jgi:hypothetical protein